MADIELRERFFGGGLVGSVDISSGPTLSWSEHDALLAGSKDLQRMRATLEDLGLDVRLVAHAIDGLEAQLGLRLDQQSVLMGRQVHLLMDIAESLRTPARVRAAERLASVGELLRRKRYDRALVAAEEAIDGDPNNPVAFTAAGWAQIGLQHLEQARAMFIEAAQASDGDQRSAAIRQAARLTLALDGPRQALTQLEENANEPHSEREHAALTYDRSVYLAELGDTNGAIACLLQAGHDDPSFLFAALADPLLASHATFIEAASKELQARQQALAQHRAAYEELLAQLGRLIEQLEEDDKQLHGTGREERREVLAKLIATRRRELKQKTALIEPAERTLRAEQLESATAELRTILDRARALKTEVFDAAVRSMRLEEAVLDFANREDAWPTKLKDGTWEITKKRRFRSTAQWRAMTTDDGQPAIEPVEQIS